MDFDSKYPITNHSFQTNRIEYFSLNLLHFYSTWHPNSHYTSYKWNNINKLLTSFFSFCLVIRIAISYLLRDIILKKVFFEIFYHYLLFALCSCEINNWLLLSESELVRWIKIILFFVYFVIRIGLQLLTSDTYLNSFFK